MGRSARGRARRPAVRSRTRRGDERAPVQLHGHLRRAPGRPVDGRALRQRARRREDRRHDLLCRRGDGVGLDLRRVAGSRHRRRRQRALGRGVGGEHGVDPPAPLEVLPRRPQARRDHRVRRPGAHAHGQGRRRPPRAPTGQRRGARSRRDARLVRRGPRRRRVHRRARRRRGRAPRSCRRVAPPACVSGDRAQRGRDRGVRSASGGGTDVREDRSRLAASRGRGHRRARGHPAAGGHRSVAPSRWGSARALGGSLRASRREDEQARATGRQAASAT